MHWSRRCVQQREHLPPLQRFEFFERPRPVRPEQTREAPVGEHLAASLAARAIIRFLVGVTNPQDFVATSWARFSEAPVH